MTYAEKVDRLVQGLEVKVKRSDVEKAREIYENFGRLGHRKIDTWLNWLILRDQWKKQRGEILNEYIKE